MAKQRQCPFCGEKFSMRYRRTDFRRHVQNCHMQPGRDEAQPIHFTELAHSPFTIKSPYGKG